MREHPTTTRHRRQRKALARPGAYIALTNTALGPEWHILPKGICLSNDDALWLIDKLSLECGGESLFDGCLGQTWRIPRKRAA